METPNMEIQTKAPVTPDERQRRNAFFISLCYCSAHGCSIGDLAGLF